jgi:hypothetical protein
MYLSGTKKNVPIGYEKNVPIGYEKARLLQTEAATILWAKGPGKKFFDKVIKKSKTRK